MEARAAQWNPAIIMLLKTDVSSSRYPGLVVRDISLYDSEEAYTGYRFLFSFRYDDDSHRIGVTASHRPAKQSQALENPHVLLGRPCNVSYISYCVALLLQERTVGQRFDNNNKAQANILSM